MRNDEVSALVGHRTYLLAGPSGSSLRRFGLRSRRTADKHFTAAENFGSPTPTEKDTAGGSFYMEFLSTTASSCPRRGAVTKVVQINKLFTLR